MAEIFTGTDCIPEKNERLVLTGCITANQYWSNLFMEQAFPSGLGERFFCSSIC